MTINLFEFGNKHRLEAGFSDLEIFLDEIWRRREKNPWFYADTQESREESQRFLQFLHNTQEIKARNYVGVIQFNGLRINLLPKVFYQKGKSYTDQEVAAINKHILWWLSYCRRLKFPHYLSSLSQTTSDFFEILIYLFARYTRQVLNNAIFQQYNEQEMDLAYVRGRLDMPRYIRENIARARWHRVSCVFDEFGIDNQFNRTLKYVASLLHSVTQVEESRRLLGEILFILDEVPAQRSTAGDCARMRFNPMFSELEVIRDYCVLFLSHSVSYVYKNQMKLFAFLLPMEYVFEDFIFGFIQQEMPEVKAEAQKHGKLDRQGIFDIKPDILLHVADRQIIADTKYKIIFQDNRNKHFGISQADLYQMVTYAMRLGVRQVRLIYPLPVGGDEGMEKILEIDNELCHDKDLTIKVSQVPIVDKDVINGVTRSGDLRRIFSPLRDRIRKQLAAVFDI